MSPSPLPLPRLERRELGSSLVVLADDGLDRAVGLSIAFTERAGGASQGPFAGLNLGAHVGDDPDAVAANRRALIGAFGAGEAAVVMPNQVHGTRSVLVASSSEEALAQAKAEAAEGADAVLSTAPGVGALLCFADCVPVSGASPTGAFAVIHGGWRGVVAGIAPMAARQLAEAEAAQGGAFSDAEEALAHYNAYVGPYIHEECFAVGEDVAARFVERFGAGCLPQEGHVDLGAALAQDLEGIGMRPERIADAGACTACAPDRFYSYRASGGTTGRHGAFAFRRARR